MATRTADELAALRSEFAKTYSGGDTADGFDDAFASHLATLDAAAPAAAPAKGKGKAKAGAKKGGAKAAPKAKAAKAPKAKAAPKPKAFRPTSDDRKALNAAAAKAAGKDVKTPRLLPKGSGTYTDFLQGKTLKLDASGNGSTTLNVVAANDPKKVVGTVSVEVKAGKMKVTGNKA